MKGNLYIITNIINNKVYIGKTYTSLEERWKRHIHDAFRIDRENNNKFYNAIRKYGIDNFQVRLIAQFEEGILEQKEQEYIVKYDSYHNGYNSTLGGDGSRYLDSHITDKIIKMYKDKETIQKIADITNVHPETIRRILRNSEIGYTPNISESKEVIMYDKNFNYEQAFKSINEAAEHIIGDVRHFRINIKYAFTNGIILYGHRWQLASDLVYEDKIFRTKFDKEAYIQGKPAYQPEGKQYYIVDGALNGLYGIEREYKCIVCGCSISKQSKTGLCRSCVQNERNKQNNKIPKPSVEQLNIDKLTLSIDEIANKYGRSRSTVCAWLYSN